MSTSVRVTVAQYDAMIARGEFVPREDHHVELIDGEIVPMSPIGPMHDDVVEKITEWSYENRPNAKVWVRGSVGFPRLDSAPEPDLAWVRRRPYSRIRPGHADILLIVEVGDCTLPFDRGEKARLYARAGVADYWIVSIPDRHVEVRRDPLGGTYRSIRTFAIGESIPLLAFPALSFPVATAFADEDDDDRDEPA